MMMGIKWEISVKIDNFVVNLVKFTRIRISIHKGIHHSLKSRIKIAKIDNLTS